MEGAPSLGLWRPPKEFERYSSELGVVSSSAETQSNLCFEQITLAAVLKIDGGKEESREACEETMGIIQAKGDSDLGYEISSLIHLFILQITVEGVFVFDFFVRQALF